MWLLYGRTQQRSDWDSHSQPTNALTTWLLSRTDNNNNNNNNNNNVYNAIVYGKAIVRVHSGYLNDCRPAPGGP